MSRLHIVAALLLVAVYLLPACDYSSFNPIDGDLETMEDETEISDYENEESGESSDSSAECSADEDCSTLFYGEGLRCSSGRCVQCEKSRECNQIEKMCIDGFCKLPVDCRDASECSQNPYYHPGCLPGGTCGQCNENAHCLPDEICLGESFGYSAGYCMDRNRIVQSCIDGTCDTFCWAVSHNGICVTDMECYHERGGETGECVSDDDCQLLTSFSRFLNPENVYCDNFFFDGTGICRECRENSDCPGKGSICSDGIYCIAVDYCESTEDCVDENPYFHKACRSNNTCDLCFHTLQCLTEETCWIEEGKEYGYCVDSDRIDSSCLDGSCANECEISTDENGQNNGVICLDG